MSARTNYRQGIASRDDEWSISGAMENETEISLGRQGEDNDERLTEDGRPGPRSEGKVGHMDVIPSNAGFGKP